MPKTVDFFYDLSSPYSWLAAERIDEVCAKHGATVRWRPFLLGGIFQGSKNAPPIQVPAKARWMLDDLAAWAKYYKLEFKFPSNFPILSIKPLRAALAAEEKGKLKEFTMAAYRAFWTKDRNITQPPVIAEIAAEVGLDPKWVLERIEQQDIKDKLKANTDEALKLGAFGAPTMVYQGKLYWGNDRLVLLEEALKED